MAARDVFGIVGTTQAGNFHVERVVAEGGFGVVYRAQHGAFRAPVALKCLKIPEEMTKQQRGLFLEKFREEAELMFRLSAAISEVVRPLHVEVLHLADGRFVPFLALEWLEGESLDGIITRRREQGQAPLGLHKVVKMLRPVASALLRAHRFPGPQGAIAIIHRDLKPENIFVANIGGTESMKILDFGIAKAKRAASQAVGRATGRSIAEDVAASFTPAYGAPEQWSPKTYGETGPWTDVWGLALTLVEALCGAPPIDGDTYVMRRACLDEKRRPTPRNLGADVPAEVERVFERALAVDPRKRFKDIEGFWSELEMAMGLEPSLRTRDARREPGEAAPQEAGAPVAGARLARIDLLKVPSVVMPAVSAPGEPAAAKAAPASKAAPPKPAPSKAPGEEDWASLGIDDVPSSRPGGLAARSPDPRGSEPRKPPPSRRHSVGMELDLAQASSGSLELPLPTHPDGAPPPVSDGHPGKAAGPPPMKRRASLLELEMSLPIQAEGAPEPAMMGMPQQAPPAPPARPPMPSRRASVELEMSLPTMESAPEPASARAGYDGAAHRPGPSDPPPRRSSGELELNLPSTTIPQPAVSAPAAPAPAASFGDSLDFELHVPGRKSAAAPPPPPAVSLQRPSTRPPGLAGGHLQVREPEPMSLRDRLKTPLALLLSGLVVGVFDFAIHKITGNPITLGPVRLSWIAAPLALAGVGFLLWRLIGVHEDE
ncbi:MAG: serine/threonine-protein kinase [Minicystis sp.]